MFPIDEATIWERRDKVVLLRATEPTGSALRRCAEENSGDDVPVLLDALIQVYGDLLSERHAIDETMNATDNELVPIMWARVQSENAAPVSGFVADPEVTGLRHG